MAEGGNPWLDSLLEAISPTKKNPSYSGAKNLEENEQEEKGPAAANSSAVDDLGVKEAAGKEGNGTGGRTIDSLTATLAQQAEDFRREVR